MFLTNQQILNYEMVDVDKIIILSFTQNTPETYSQDHGDKLKNTLKVVLLKDLK